MPIIEWHGAISTHFRFCSRFHHQWQSSLIKFNRNSDCNHMSAKAQDYPAQPALEQSCLDDGTAYLGWTPRGPATAPSGKGPGPGLRIASCRSESSMCSTGKRFPTLSLCAMAEASGLATFCWGLWRTVLKQTLPLDGVENHPMVILSCYGTHFDSFSINFGIVTQHICLWAFHIVRTS